MTHKLHVWEACDCPCMHNLSDLLLTNYADLYQGLTLPLLKESGAYHVT